MGIKLCQHLIIMSPLLFSFGAILKGNRRAGSVLYENENENDREDCEWWVPCPCITQSSHLSSDDVPCSLPEIISSVQILCQT